MVAWCDGKLHSPNLSYSRSDDHWDGSGIYLQRPRWCLHNPVYLRYICLIDTLQASMHSSYGVFLSTRLSWYDVKICYRLRLPWYKSDYPVKSSGYTFESLIRGHRGEQCVCAKFTQCKQNPQAFLPASFPHKYASFVQMATGQWVQ